MIKACSNSYITKDCGPNRYWFHVFYSVPLKKKTFFLIMKITRVSKCVIERYSLRLKNSLKMSNI